MALAASLMLTLQACGCKHYPFELLQDEVAEPLHAKIMAHKAQTGHYPDGGTVGAYLKANTCQYHPGSDVYPSGEWQCGEHRYRLLYWNCEADGGCSELIPFQASVTLYLGDFTSCDYTYGSKGFDRSRNVVCVHASCISKYLH